MTCNTWLHRLAGKLVKPFAGTPLTPNHLTTARLLTGIIAAACFVADQMLWNVTGAIFFLVSMLLDRADGELARLQSSSSRAGALYDIISDAVCITLTFLALGVAAMDHFTIAWAIIIALLAGVSVSLIFVQIILTETVLGEGGGKFDSMAGFDADDAVVVIPVAVVAGYGEWLLVGAGIIAPVVLIIISLKLYRRRQIWPAVPARER